VHALRLRRQRQVAVLRQINEEGLARLDRDWDRLPLPTEPPLPDGQLSLARDLDLFGRASLFHLLGTAHTPAAKALLRDRLAGRPAVAADIPDAQAAVAELAGELDLRQRLEAATRGLERHPPDCEPFLRWAEAAPWLRRRPALLWLARIATAATLASLGAAAAAGTGVRPVLLLAAFNLAFSFVTARWVQPRLGDAGTRREAILLYATALGVVDSHPFATPRLRAVAAPLAPADGLSAAHAALAKLETRLSYADLRHAAPLHFLLQALTLWDFHVLATLETWQSGAGRRARAWLEALGEIEALAALATLRFEEPAWCFPRVADDAAEFAAQALGHPLLPAARRVTNDVAVGPAGTFLLVTGSNMSGKSTLLRAIGLNAVLAQAGGPACAAALSLPPLALATSILVEDSLAAGVSFYLAELLRIKAVVTAADDARAAGRGGGEGGSGGGSALLYLLDEVLRGTNSAERRIAVRHVLRHLLSRGALGAISTHDLELATGEPEIAAAARPVHFRETLSGGREGPRMTFDYRLRPGVATTTNALELLRQVGLGDE
jgi:MutS domain V